jgi:hypothetical protein
MAKYELLEGSHLVSDTPMVVASKGEVVESDRDLVAIFGEQKFKLVEGDKKPEAKKGAKAE